MAEEEGASSGVESAYHDGSDVDGTASSAMRGAASSSAGARKRKRDDRPNKTDRKQSAPGEWEAIVAGVTKEEALAALEQERVLVLPHSNAQWSPGVWKPLHGYNNKEVRRRIYRCPFRGSANAECQALMRLTQDSQNNWTLERSHKAHADHNITNKQRGLPKGLVYAATSPRKAAMSTYQVAHHLRDQIGALSATERQQLGGLRKREQTRQRTKLVPAELHGTFGGVRTWADQHTRAALVARNEFGVHATYVLGTPQIDAQSGVINIAVSTENLLLNAYRQSVHGMPTIVHVDCTHRLVLDGHASMLFGTVDTAQQWHTVVPCDRAVRAECVLLHSTVLAMPSSGVSDIIVPCVLDWLRRVRPGRRCSACTCVRVHQDRGRRHCQAAHSGSATHLRSVCVTSGEVGARGEAVDGGLQ